MILTAGLLCYLLARYIVSPVLKWEQSLRDRYTAALRSTLDAATLEREGAGGRAMTLREAAAALAE